MIKIILAGLTFIFFSRASVAELQSDVGQLIQMGEYYKAEQLLRNRIHNHEAPVMDSAAIQLEILRRIRIDFSVTEEQLLTELQESIDDVTLGDIQHWRESGVLTHRVIDGKVRYFRRTGANLFLIDEDAIRRRNHKKRSNDQARSANRFDLNTQITKLIKLSESSDSAELFPVLHRVKYKLSVNKNHPRLKAGAVVRAWLPFPQEYRQQRDVQLVSAEPKPYLIATNGVPHRSIYFEQTVKDASKAPVFLVEFTFITSAYCPSLDPEEVQPYDVGSELYQNYTIERLPHIDFTPRVRKLVSEIVEEEQNPLLKAQRIFRWISRNIPWCGEMEYSIIPNLSEKGLRARRGDCGVQAMTFITLCRAAGVPARWQSGWETKPLDWNMHDWAEMYIEPWGWLPVDASNGLRDHEDPRVRNFYCGHIDPYRLIVNLDYAQPLIPEKTSFRSEPNDFQRGEVEIDGHNLYFDEWSWNFEIETQPIEPIAD